MSDNLEQENDVTSQEQVASQADTDTSTPAEDNVSTEQDPAPAAEDNKEPAEKEGMLSTVERILGIGKKDKKDEPAAEQADGSDEGGDADQAPQADDAAGDKEGEGQKPEEGEEEKGSQDQDVPKEIAEHPAFKKLEQENQQFTASHERMTQLHGFMEQNNLTPDDMTAAMNGAALRKQSGVPETEFERADQLTLLAHSNPEEFYNKLVAMTEEYGVFLGKSLPSDLQKDVDDGNITTERAQELSRARVEKQISDRKAEVASTRAEQSGAMTVGKNQEDLVNRWFDRTAKGDVELPMKVKAIEGEMLRLLGERERKGVQFSGNEKDVFELLDEAHKNVTEDMRRFKPKKPVDPAPRSNPAPAHTTDKQDQTPEEQMVDGVLSIMNRQTG